MKVIKNKYIIFPSLEDTIGQSINNKKSAVRRTDFELTPAEQQKRIRFYYVINKFNAQLLETDDLDSVLNYLKNSLREILPLKDAFLFLFDDNNNLTPAGKQKIEAYTNFVNKAYKNGILDWLFETKKISALPDITKAKNKQTPLNLIVLPIFKNDKPQGIYCIVTPIGSLSTHSFEAETIQIFLSLVQNRIDIERQKTSLSSAYEDLQLLQSKLTNDYKYSAIGELTAGIVEDVMDPVQVVLSCANFIEKEYQNVDRKLTGTISSQIKKIENVLKRLSKFAGAQPAGDTLMPCVLNEPVKDYYDVVLSSLRYKNYECILDLDENLPPILTSKTYIYQLLTNMFGLVLNTNVDGGGILIQSKFVNNQIILRFVVTDRLNIYSDDNSGKRTNLNIKMISNIVKKHQGEIKIINNESGGTSIILNFPIKRKLKK
ncbi:MAG: HAMP domain-containing histidine kinase [Melioribacteraceae bacterium]|nr:HAMP domain-containing histidine kinase [Melioribacteraceae bacterium]